jgi:NADPH-dependent 2,4-dienoyl-CoA reductase/sulfur reductase-like enzyme
MARSINRRQFLGGLLGVSAALLGAGMRTSAGAKVKARIVVVGAGVGGCRGALALRRLLPKAEIVVIEKEAKFVWRPAAFEYALGLRGWENITRSYDALTAQGIRIIQTEMLGIDPARQRIATSGGPQDYDLLLLASGIRLASESIKGLDQSPGVNACVYDPSQLPTLHKRLADYQGGTILISIPQAPLQCPPAPYEFVLLLSEHIRRRGLKGKIVVLDANTSPQPAPLASAFDAALQRHQDVVEYIPWIQVGAVEPAAKRVVSADGEAFSYELLSLIPRHRAARFIAEAGLAQAGDAFVEVDPVSFRSARVETIYAVGDAARTPYARTASAASACAELCARAMAKALGAVGLETEPPSTFESPCYPYVTGEQALLLRIAYALKPGNEGPRIDTRVESDTTPRTEYVAERAAWEQDLLKQIFGASS